MQNDTAISSCISLCNHHLHGANECFIPKTNCKSMKFQFKKTTFSHSVTFFMLFWLMNALYMVPAKA